MSETKPHKGKIERWYRSECTDKGLGYLVYGHMIDHPSYRGGEGHTSYVVAHDPKTGEIETRNSRYTLVGDENPEGNPSF